jgi:hypothetical protein
MCSWSESKASKGTARSLGIELPDKVATLPSCSRCALHVRLKRQLEDGVTPVW